MVHDDTVYGCFPMWDQARIRDDGTWIHVRAGVVNGFPPGEDTGKPAKHASFSDEMVAQTICAHLLSYDVVFISENTKLNEKGIRSLIRKAAISLQGGVQLAALYKRGRTSYPEYCNKLKKKIEAWNFDTPYHEELI